MSNRTIKSILKGYSSAELLQTDAIIHQLPRLSSQLGCNVHILRDDLTGFALGGNKTRKLDYLVGDALAQNADTLVTMNASSFSRNAAAAGQVCGLEMHVVMVGDESEQNPASQSFFKQHETHLHYITHASDLVDSYNDVVESLKKDGKAVYELHPGGSDSIGALGYVDAFDQILSYSLQSGVHFSDIILSTGSTGTQAGLVIRQCISELDVNIVGISASQPASVQHQRVRELGNNVAELIGIELDECKIIVDDSFIGPGYAIPSDEGRNAVKVFSSQEGILLDQVYSGKAAAGMIHYARSEMFAGDNILFIHTGGNGGMYY